MNINDVKNAYVPEQSNGTTDTQPETQKGNATEEQLADEMNFSEEDVQVEDAHTSTRTGKIFTPNESRYIIVTFASNAHMLREKLSAYKKLLRDNVDDIVNELFGPQ